MSFFRFFVTRHTFALLLTLMIIILGLVTLPNIKRDTFPKADLEEIVITTTYPGASPIDIEQKITNKVEDSIKSIAGIKKYTSYSLENSSLINVRLDPDLSDPDDVKQRIREAVDGINTFPADLEDDPTIVEIDTSAFPILEVGVTSETLDYPELREITKKFEDSINDIPGITRMDSFGYLAKEIQIFPIPDKIEQYQISLLQIISAITNRNTRASMGNLSDAQTGIKSTIVNDSRLFDIDDLRNMIVRSNFNGQSIRVSDVALVRMDYEEEFTKSRLMGFKGISYNIIKSGDADIIKVTKKIDETIQFFESTYPEIQIIKANDFSKYLKNRLNVMITNGIIGLIFVILVLTFFLNIRMAFWVSLGIPVSVMGVFFLMPPFDMTINILSLLALIIVIGIIVDDGIIIAENIAKKQEAGLSPIEASVAGISDVFKPVITTIFTTIIAFSPMFFMSGIMGKFVYQIPLVITIALLISMVEVIIALPSHIASTKPLSLSSVETSKRHQFIKRLRTKYETLLNHWLQKKYTLAAGFAIVFIGSLIFAKLFMNFVLFPKSNAVQFYVRVEAPAGTSLTQTSESMVPIEQEILKLPKNELLAFTTRVGMTGDSYFMMEQENVGIILVDLVPFTGRDRNAQEIMEEIKSKTENTPGFTKISFQVESGGPPVGKAISIQVIAEDDETRDLVSTRIYDFVESTEGVLSVERSDRKQKQQLNINFDYESISRLGLDIASIQNTIRTAFSGSVASTLRMGDEDINFMVKFSKKDRRDLEKLSTLRIPNNQNRLISLGDISTFNYTDGSPNYYHYNGDRSTTISGDIDSDIITSRKLTDLVSETFNSDAYPDVTFIFGGETEETNESVQGLLRSFVAALIGIFFLLVLLFNSFWQPFMVILTVPFGLIGVIIAFALHGEDLGFISMIGTIGLIGVVVNDSLVLVNHLNDMTRSTSDKQSFIKQVVIGSGDRFRPILITSFSTVAGLLPLAYGLGGSDPFIAPMALAIGYGLLFSTPLTLFLLPALYVIFDDIYRYIQQKRS